MPAQRSPFGLPNFQRNAKLASHVFKVLDNLYDTLRQLEYNPMPPEPLEVSDAMTPRKRSLLGRIFPPIYERTPTKIIDAWQVCDMRTSGFLGMLHLDVLTGNIYVSGTTPIALPLSYERLLFLPTDDLLELVTEARLQSRTITTFVSTLTPA